MAAPTDTPARAWMRAMETTARATRDPERTLPRAVSEWAERRGDAPALISERESFSYRELAARMNQYSRWALSEGVERGETVALMMGNRPEYVAIWLGLSQVGVVVAFISPELRAEALAHALGVADARRLIASAECAKAITSLDSAIELWTHGWIDAALRRCSGKPLAPHERRPVTLADKALRIFTSGTTGLPKAAEVSHRRIVVWTHWFAGLANLNEADRLYDCLPMHHSVGGVVAIGAPLVAGGAAAIAPKFSTGRFFDDIARWDCTGFQYIGELCRYLVASPTNIREKRTKLRLALGNGLAAPVWAEFARRFPGVRVLEFYASTEGNVWLYNVEGRIGALGKLPPFVAAKSPIALVRFDAEAQAPARGADGFCEACDEGEALGRISGEAASRFEGYSDQAETEKKILRDVFAPGDAWMRTGDLMRRDAEGFYYFVDRVGDTFRWKGENVAVEEVAAVLRACPGVTDALVYGVKVAGHEGRAGMAALTGTFDWLELERRLEALPRWARPVFLRLTDEIARTETFKPRRALYVAQGFDPGRVEDRLYVLGENGYRTLDGEVFQEILRAELRL